MKPASLTFSRFLLSLTPLLVFCAFAGCKTGGDVSVNFRMNGRDIAASEIEPVADAGGDAMLVVQVGDTIKLWDVSEPKSNIDSRTWDINDDGKVDYEGTDYPPDIAFTAPGSHKITLCINTPDQCISKWVKVTGRAPAVQKQEPSITVLSPRSTNRKVSSSRIPIRLQTRNIYNREDITVKVDGVPVSDFTFNNGLISGTVDLALGTNNIEVAALTNSGQAREVIRIKRETAVAQAVPRQPRPTPSPNVTIGGVVSETTEASAIDLRFAAKNASRDQIDATVNGRSIPNSSISLDGNKGLLKKVPLEIGLNDVVITARTAGGTTTSRYSVERLKLVEPVRDDPAVVYTPAPAPPPVADPEPDRDFVIIEPTPSTTPDPAIPPMPPPDPVRDPAPTQPAPQPDVAPAPAPEPKPTTITPPPAVVDNKPPVTRPVFQPVSDPPAKPAPPPVQPTVNTTSGSGVAWFGVPAANVRTGSCDEYGVTATSMQVSPREKVVLMGADVYSSGCGTLTVTLSTGRASITEFFELSEGQSSLTFNRLSEKELVSNLRYKISLKTGPSPNCESNTPKLLDAKACGKSSSGDARVALNYGDNVSLFSIKYKY